MVAQGMRMPASVPFDRSDDPRAAPLATRAAIVLGIVESVDGLSALGPEWSALFDDSAAPHQVFQTFEWLWTWSLHYRESGLSLAIVTGRVDGDLVLVWPLVIKRRLGLRILSFMGEPVSQYGDALLRRGLSQADQDAALDFVLELPADVVSLRRVRADAALAPLLRRRLGPPSSPQQAPFVDFAGATTVDAFQSRFAGKLRSGRRRHLRRLEALGPVGLEILGPSPEAAALVGVALAFKRDWARRAGVLAPAIADPRFERFFTSAASGQGPSPALRVCVLRCAGDIAGIELSVGCKGRMFGHVLAPRPGFEKQAVGTILAGFAITSALEQGFTVYDTLAPADAYKRDWTETTVDVGDHAWAGSALGAVYVWAWLRFGRGALKATAKAVRALRSRHRP